MGHYYSFASAAVLEGENTNMWPAFSPAKTKQKDLLKLLSCNTWEMTPVTIQPLWSNSALSVWTLTPLTLDEARTSLSDIWTSHTAALLAFVSAPSSKTFCTGCGKTIEGVFKRFTSSDGMLYGQIMTVCFLTLSRGLRPQLLQNKCPVSVSMRPPASTAGEGYGPHLAICHLDISSGIASA